MATLGVALIGAGFAGGIHAQAWSAVDGVRIALVVEPDEAAGRAVAARHASDWAPDLVAALDRADVDVVDVCAPTGLHAEITAAAATAGKHVLCEKPLALDLDEADRAIEACAEAGVTFMVGHVLRFWPEYVELGRLVREGSLGALRAISCSRLVQPPDWTADDWVVDPSRSRGVAAEILIHDLDVLLWLVGRPRSLSACAFRDGEAWAHLQVLLRYRDGPLAVAEAGWDAPRVQPFAAGFRAVFDLGIVEYDSRRDPTLSVVADGGFVEIVREPASAAEGTEGGPWSFAAAGYLEEVQYFADCVRNRLPCERCPAEAARAALELALATIASAERGEEIPFEPNPRRTRPGV